jgi:1,4-alpha-glucan branching enzyme
LLGVFFHLEIRRTHRDPKRLGFVGASDDATVVIRQYDHRAKRAEWQYDSTVHEDNIYYWYEGRPSDYPDYERAAHDLSRPLNKRPAPGHGGYLDNGSSGYTPRFWEETVRQQFISSAVFLVEEMHVDGLRVDLAQALHRDNRRHADGRAVGDANIFGQKLLREWSRTLRMIRPSVMLIAEEHPPAWDAVTKSATRGGLGFDARWAVEFYHNLIGDSEMAGETAHLLKVAGFGGDGPLRMDWFAGALDGSRHRQVVFHESHDEAGNARGTARTVVTAVNGATRIAAEARARVCFGLSLLSAGVPMFFMGEEVGAQKRYTHDDFLKNREDLLGERAGNGKAMYRFYQDIITLRRRLRSIRGHNIDILHQSNSNRVVAFKRWDDGGQVIIVASLNNAPFANGYVIAKDLLAIPDGGWKEIFNSDSVFYGGHNVGNNGIILNSFQGRLDTIIPANGFVVLVRQ